MSRKRNSKNRRRSMTEHPTEDTPADGDTSPTEASKTKFLAARQLGASVVEAARWAGIPRAIVYRWRRSDPDFAQAWNDPRDKVVRGLEFEAFKRAIHGNDRLLVFLLKSYHPDLFNERRHSKLLDREDGENHFTEFLFNLRRQHGAEEALEVDNTRSPSHEPSADPSAPSQEEVRDRDAVPVRQPDPYYASDEDMVGPPALELAYLCPTLRPSIRI